MYNGLFNSDISSSTLVFNDLTVRFITIGTARRSVNPQIPPHAHDYFEFYALTTGHQYTKLQGYEFFTEAGTFFLCPPNCEHSHRFLDDDDEQGLVVRFRLSKNSQTDCMKVADRIIGVLSTPHITGLRGEALINLLLDVDPAMTPEQLQLRLLSWLLRLTETVEQDDHFISMRRYMTPFDHKELIRGVILTIETTYMGNLSVRYLAETHHISYRHLTRIFLEVTGYTVTSFITLIRIRSAMRLLNETDLPIKEISRRCGYHSEFYFSTQFTDTVGLSPTAYRSVTDPALKRVAVIDEFVDRMHAVEKD